MSRFPTRPNALSLYALLPYLRVQAGQTHCAGLSAAHVFIASLHAMMLLPRFLATAFLLLVAVSAHADAWQGTVTWVTDGDTLWVRPDTGGRARKLRLQGVDAPESCQSGGAQARQALIALALNQRVSVQTHARDGWGRSLATVRLRGKGGEDVAARMARQGWAWSYGRGRSRGPYAAQEAAARQARRGVFAHAAEPERPADFRRRHGPCARAGH